jgi:hypothetical protein
VGILWSALGFLVLLGIWGVLAARSRRKEAQAALPPEARAAAARDGENAWVARVTQSIPTVVRRLAEGEPKGNPERGGLGLQGNLGQTPLHDLMQYLALGRKSGVLELASGRRTGRLVLGEGKVLKAAYRGKEGMEAAFLMLDLAEGDFEFYEQAKAETPSQPPLEVVDVIMLWMARKPKKKQAT